MKKKLLLLIMLFIFPVMAGAEEYAIEYKVGDAVLVNIIEGEDPRLFHVIRHSAPQDNYVWLLYHGNVGHVVDGHLESSTVYDQTVPPIDEHDPGKEATVILEESIAGGILAGGTADWKTAETPRLLNLSDLNHLGLKKDSTGDYYIPADKPYLAPILIEGFNQPDLYNYWTMIPELEAENASVYAVIYNEDYDGDSLTPLAHIKSHDISQIDINPKFLVRPVVKVDKTYIDCFADEPEPEPEPEDVPTSETIIPLEVTLIAGVALVSYVLIKRKDLFYKN